MKITILLVFILFLSCGRIPNRDFKTSLRNSDTVHCIQRDTVTLLGTKIGYLQIEDSFSITWGDDSYQRVYDSLYSCEYDKNTGVWDFVPKFNSETKNNIVLTNTMWTSSGANPAPLEFLAIILPKNKKDSPLEIEFFIAKENDYVVYGDAENPQIHLINLETKQIQDITLKPEPALSRSPTLAIVDTKLQKRSLYIKYQIVDKNGDLKNVRKKIKIEI